MVFSFGDNYLSPNKTPLRIVIHDDSALRHNSGIKRILWKQPSYPLIRRSAKQHATDKSICISGDRAALHMHDIPDLLHGPRNRLPQIRLLRSRGLGDIVRKYTSEFRFRGHPWLAATASASASLRPHPVQATRSNNLIRFHVAVPRTRNSGQYLTNRCPFRRNYFSRYTG